MSDDLKNGRSADRSRISPTEKWEVQYCTNELKRTEAHLAAVEKVRDGAAALRAHLPKM